METVTAGWLLKAAWVEHGVLFIANQHPAAYAPTLAASLQGIWWMPEAADAQPQHLAGSAAALRAAAAEVGRAGGEGGLAGPELLKLAAALRMNTGVCVVAGGASWAAATAAALLWLCGGRCSAGTGGA